MRRDDGRRPSRRVDQQHGVLARAERGAMVSTAAGVGVGTGQVEAALNLQALPLQAALRQPGGPFAIALDGNRRAHRFTWDDSRAWGPPCHPVNRRFRPRHFGVGKAQGAPHEDVGAKHTCPEPKMLGASPLRQFR
jgi:hypothetical protein